MVASYDAVVVGSGPNGLSAAITLAREGVKVLVVEAQEDYGGGLRSGADTLPGFVHDRGATVHALTLASPVMRSFPLAAHGLRLAQPLYPFAHPLDGPRSAGAVVVGRPVGETAAVLGEDGDAYRRLMAPLVRRADEVTSGVLAPARIPAHPLAMARFGLPGLLDAQRLARGCFRTPQARALIGGLAAHSFLRLDEPLTGAFALVLGLTTHSVGWPVAVGGSQAVAAAMVSVLRSYGGEVATGWRIDSPGDLPATRAVLLDTSPRTLLGLAGSRLPDGYRRRLERFRYGPGVFKVDWALDGPVPWRDPLVGRAGTVHVCGTLEEIAAAEATVAGGGHPERPYVLVVAPTVADPSRAPEGKHVLWAYVHVPAGSTVDMTDRMEAQIERFAPGFRERVLARRVWTPRSLEAANPSLIGGAIGGGVQDWRQLFTRPGGLRTVLDPYVVPMRGASAAGVPPLFLCSSATPPGGGAHGMSGWWAARSALRRVFGVSVPPLAVG